MKNRIVQFHPAISDGDAISTCLLDVSDLIKSNGNSSEIVVERNDSENTNIKLLADFQFDPDDCLIIHHSLGFEDLDFLLGLSCRKILWFHNITPVDQLQDDFLKRLSRLGREQLVALRNVTNAAITDSYYSARELKAYGFSQLLVHPPGYEHLKKLDRTQQEKGLECTQLNNWLFVGRIAKNKNQIELIENFAKYRHFNEGAHLTLVGGVSEPGYKTGVEDAITGLQLGSCITVTGKVSESTKNDLYQASDVYVSASRHEGYGVPFFEAMRYELPIVAYRCGAVAEIVMEAGVLVSPSEANGLVEGVKRLHNDASALSHLALKRSSYLSELENELPIRQQELLDFLVSDQLPPATSIRVEGPFETTYSLAQVNRNLAQSLASQSTSEIALSAIEGLGHYEIDNSLVEVLQSQLPMIESRRNRASVVIRQTYPPRLDDVCALGAFCYFGWEETVVPRYIVDHFNEFADGIGVMSNFVADICVASGVSVPIEVIGVGVNKPTARYSVNAERDVFQFLSITSGFPRKGLDLLLAAYVSQFGWDSNTKLVLKTFPNIHNDIDSQLAQVMQAYPDALIEHISGDVSAEEIGALYLSSDCYVHSSRGEGFGLGAAEAMAIGVPVIGCSASGSADFLTDETAITVPFRSARSRSHMNLAGSAWFEPDVTAMAKAMRSIRDGEVLDLQQKVDAAKELISSDFSWSTVGWRWANFVQKISEAKRRKSVCVVSPFSVGCGIAQYSHDLYSGFGRNYTVRVLAHDASAFLDHPSIDLQVCWENGFGSNKNDLFDEIIRDTSDALHVQLNYGFLSPAAFAALLDLSAHSRKVVTVHRTAPLEIGEFGVISIDDYGKALTKADTVIVHSETDRHYLETRLDLRNVKVIPIGVNYSQPLPQNEARSRLGIPEDSLVIGTVGFALPHKRLEALVSACHLLRRQGIDCRLLFECATHADLSSLEYVSAIESEISRLNLRSVVYWYSGFDDLKARIARLSACNVVTLGYGGSGESSSAAFRTAVQSGRPVRVSTSEIFRDLEGAFGALDPEDDGPQIAAEAVELWLDGGLVEEAENISRMFVESNNLNFVRRSTERVLFDP